LRVAVGMPAVVSAVSTWTSAPVAESVLIHGTALCCGSLLLLGLWTPLASFALALAEVSPVLFGRLDFMHLAAALVPLSLAALGPGAWSIDARLYGRKRIRV
jgi:uncharacterized membrane protein YphA (DoxX/SURF4 family)